MYEAKHQPVLSVAHFYRRVVGHMLVMFALLLGSLLMGMIGYVATEGMSWLDAFLNAAMLLGGMGPINPLQTSAGKLFAGCFALYAGLLFVVSTALVITPILHRVLHVFHVDDDA